MMIRNSLSIAAERTALAKSNAKEVMERNTWTARKAQSNNDDTDMPGPAEPDLELQAQLLHDRRAIRERHEATPLKVSNQNHISVKN